MPVQAAEHALRTHEGFDRVDDVGLERSERHRGVSTSTFRTPMGRFSVSIAIEESAPSFLTCHSHVAEPAPRTGRSPSSAGPTSTGRLTTVP